MAERSPPIVELESSSRGIRSIKVSGAWSFDNLEAMRRALETLHPDRRDPVVFRCDGATRIDLTGAWTLFGKALWLEAAGIGTDFQGLKADHFKFLEQVRQRHPGLGASVPNPTPASEPSNRAPSPDGVNRKHSVRLPR